MTIVRDDITKLRADAIVNAVNPNLKKGGGVCGAIFSAAGEEKLQAVCDALSPIQTGKAVITPGFALHAKHIIHTAGPVYRDGKQGEEALLRACYTNALDLALEHGCESVAFPLISSGIYGYPKDEALSVATSAIADWLQSNDMDVSLVVFDKAAFSVSRELFDEVKAFVDENYVDELETRHRRGRSKVLAQKNIESIAADSCASAAAPASRLSAMRKESKLSDAFERLDEPFSTTLLRLIAAKGKTDVEVYKRANIDRKLFSKIRTGRGYMPSKKTVIALAVALKLSLAETNDLLERAGYILSRSVMFDVIVKYFITREKYDIYEINNVLFEYDQPILGG
ncbi:MAG: macro domain-containing protein [Syntrophorhabdaceae bacterium]|nr:macro domain-containing protein [Syntrophorhabdaceae bacterium]